MSIICTLKLFIDWLIYSFFLSNVSCPYRIGASVYTHIYIIRTLKWFNDWLIFLSFQRQLSLSHLRACLHIHILYVPLNDLLIDWLIYVLVCLLTYLFAFRTASALVFIYIDAFRCWSYDFERRRVMSDTPSCQASTGARESIWSIPLYPYAYWLTLYDLYRSYNHRALLAEKTGLCWWKVGLFFRIFLKCAIRIESAHFLSFVLGWRIPNLSMD